MKGKEREMGEKKSPQSKNKFSRCLVYAVSLPWKQHEVQNILKALKGLQLFVQTVNMYNN